MCQFKSAIVLKDESVKGGFRLLLSPCTESHSELINIHKLNDGAHLHFARVEYTPAKAEEAYLPDTYKLRLDEERKPDWFTSEVEEGVAERMKAYIKSIIVDGEADLLIGGQFILGPNARVGSAKECVITVMCGGTLNAMFGGTLNAMWGGTLNAMWGGTLLKIWKHFDGFIKRVGSLSKIVNDERPKHKKETKKKAVKKETEK
jgi:hypothetical protein